MTEALHPNVRRVVAAGAEVGFEVRPRGFAEYTRTAHDAARAIGVQVAQIVKSLVFLADGSPVGALVGGDRRLDEAKLATAAGASGLTHSALGGATDDDAEVSFFCVAPDVIGTGIGRILFADLVEAARSAGFSRFRIDSDPGAAGFYERMGAVFVGNVPGRSVPGRLLPSYRFEVL